MVQIHDHDRAQTRVGDERRPGFHIDPDIVEVTLLRRDVLAERNRLRDFVFHKIDIDQLRPAPNDFLHLRRGRIEHPKAVALIDVNALHANEVIVRRAR